MMTQNTNKVLTVSYGTFSCTLEGFDNSFDMMKTVAEYFRDLAAEDRFFGAEPPKLDAEILGILEQRGKQLGIDTRKSGETSIVLTPSQAFDEEPEEVKTPSTPVPTHSGASSALSLDERLDRIKAVTSSNPEPEHYLEDEHADEHEDIAEIHAPQLDAIPMPIADPIIDKDASADSAPVSIVDHIEFDNSAIEAAIETAEPDPTQSTVLEELVDAPQAQSDAGPLHHEVLAEELAEEDILEEEEPVKAQSIQPTVDANDPQNIDVKHSVDPTETLDDDPHNDVEEQVEISEQSDDLYPSDQDQKPATVSASSEEIEMDDFEDALTQDLMESDDARDDTQEFSAPDDTHVAGSGAEDTEIHQDAEDVAGASNDTETTQTRSPLRLEQPNATQVDERTPLRKPRVHVINVSPAPEVIADTDQEDQPEDFQNSDAETVAVRRPKRPVAKTRRDTANPVDTADVARLMDETDQQMAKPESNRRRNALAHLRAAVAATIADKSLSKEGNDSTEAYRNDLAKAVRPRRPETTGARKSAPLRLVAEQRIDDTEIPQPAPEDEPTQVAVSEQANVETSAQIVQAEPSEFADFGQFAAHVGAHSLEAKLEAAATYLSQVRGIDQFSRPQLLRTVKLSGTEGDFSREESLQHFAHMLRTGKLMRKEDGLFEVTEEIGYQVMPKAG